MPEPSNERTNQQRGIALLMMDFQNTIVEMVPESRRQRVLSHAQVLLGKARAANVPVFHVVVRFRAGHPEVHPANKGFSAIKAAGRLLEGTPGAEIHASVSPVAGEPVVTKRRVGAFGTTDLRTMLGAQGIHTLVLAGLVTGGVVTTTVREAADLDFTLYVVADACDDPDEEVHRVLTGKVFARQATVVNTAEIDRVFAPGASGAQAPGQ